ncbi:MAG: prepilin-type N-terminal cleavage/methylation domain-containing protein [bacterium]|nr:prepilin-type N-terminal cleavage/methylation domain-containing protein [bacterium]
MKKNKGFTIVEMLVTVAVLAIFLGLTLNISQSSLQKASFTAAFNQFVADFYYARQLASLENRYVAIIFDVSGRFYDISVQTTIDADLSDPATYIHHKRTEPLGGKPFFDYSATQDFTFSPTGVVRPYPLDFNDDPISLTLTFYKAQEISQGGSYAVKYYKRTVRIYPSGGIKIGKEKFK